MPSDIKILIICSLEIFKSLKVKVFLNLSSVSISDNKNCVIIKRNKLYVVNDTKDETPIETTNTIIEGPTENTPLKEDQDKKKE
jgi:hypothetical protein